MIAMLPQLCYSPIGIDLGSRMIKLAQLRRTRAGWRLHAAVIVPQPVPNHPVEAQTARYLQGILHRHGFRGLNAVLAVPNHQLEVDVLELPPRSSGAPVEQIARLELARTAKLEDEQFELKCWDLPTSSRAGDNTATVMAVALRHSHADTLIEPFEAEGLHIRAIDARCCSLARAARAAHDAQAITAILDIGWNSSLLVLVRDGVVVYQRLLTDSGFHVAFNTISEEFRLGPEETDFVLQQMGVGSDTPDERSARPGLGSAGPRVRQIISWFLESLVDQIDAVFDYSAHRYADTPVKTLLLVGGGSTINQICPFMTARLDLQSKVLSPAQIIECPPDLLKRCSDGMLTHAIGLAWHGWEASNG